MCGGDVCQSSQKPDRGQLHRKGSGQAGSTHMPKLPEAMCTGPANDLHLSQLWLSLPSHPVMSGLALLFLSLVIYLKCEEVSRMPSSLSCITDRGRFLGRELRSTSARLSVVAAEGMELFALEHRVLSH